MNDRTEDEIFGLCNFPFNCSVTRLAPCSSWGISLQHASRSMLSLLCCCCMGPLVINYGCNAKAVKFVVSSIIFMLKATKALQ